MSKWFFHKIGDLCDSISDTYNRTDDMVILINTSDVLEGNVTNHQLVTNENLKGQFKKTFRKNDILYSEIRPANKRFAFIDFDDTERYIASTKLMVLRPNTNIILPQFLFAILKSKEIIDELQHLAETRSGTFPQITFSSELAPMNVMIPDFTTQKQIVGILSAIEDKIKLNAAINKNLEQQLLCIYHNMFDTSSNFCELGEVINTSSGGTPSRKKDEYYQNGSFYWVKSKELSGTYIIDTEEKITQSALDSSAAKILPQNSILIAMYGATVGEYGILSIPMACNQAICALLPNDCYPYTYLFMFAKCNKQNLINLAVGSAQQNISQVLIKQLPICADIDTIRDFHILTQPLFSQINALVIENSRLSMLRDALLPKLMNGEIDVSKVKV